jgi:hypothetical protein
MAAIQRFFVDFFRATAMLSTRFGYVRPAVRARARASAFCAPVSFLPFCPVFFFGFERRHGASDDERFAGMTTSLHV